MPTQTLLAPSILSANFTRLAQECQAVLDAGADLLHVDVMDGHYVPNLTIGLPVVEALRREFPEVVLDVHLMIDNPDEFVVAYAEAGASIVSFHPETSRHPHRALQAIRQAGARSALALNPGTPLGVLDYLLDDLDMVLIMSVNPGFGGQSFIPGTLDKLRALRALLQQRGKPDLDVEVDGGVKASNIGQIVEAGANVLVAGSAVFNAPDYVQSIQALRDGMAR